MQLLCKPLPTTPVEGREIKYVRIFHPSDCVAGNEFLVLPALDVFTSISNSSASEQVADVYHHPLALDICRVVAGNQSGYFTLLENNSPIPNTSQWLEGSTDYIFHLDSGDNNYSIIVEFSSWKYPPELPESWKSITEDMSRNLPCSKSDASPVVKTRDMHCRVCAHVHGLTCAHFIPVKEKKWFGLNHMKDYCYDSVNGIDDIANQVGMRMDLHILGFDRGEFCIAVKTGRAVIHVLQAGPVVRNELIPLYHNSPFDTDALSIPFIYSRFAWSIFYKGMIRLRDRQQFLIAKEGVSESVASYVTRLELFSRPRNRAPKLKGASNMPSLDEEDVEMKGQDDEGHEWNTLSEDDRSEDEDDVSEGLEEQPTNTTADDEARWKVRFPFFYTENGMADPHQYEMLGVYPGMDKITELKGAWHRTHPQIHLLANPGELPPAGA